MIYSFIGLGKPLAAVNNTLKNHIREYHKAHPGASLPLEPGGIFASDISRAAAFAGDNDMCVYMTIEDLLQKSDIIFIFLSDKALRSISLTIGKYIIKGKVFCHFSPAFGADILDFNSSNTYISMYLPRVFKDDEGHTVAKRIISEGYGRNLDKIKDIFSELSMDISFVSADEKLMYLTAASIARDMPLVLKYTAKRLAKYALASHGELCNELTDIMMQTPSDLNSYNAIDSEDVDFVQRQCEALKSLGMSDITDLFCSLSSISAKLAEPTEKTSKIVSVVSKTMEKNKTEAT